MAALTKAREAGADSADIVGSGNGGKVLETLMTLAFGMRAYDVRFCKRVCLSNHDSLVDSGAFSNIVVNLLFLLWNCRFSVPVCTGRTRQGLGRGVG